MVSIPVLAEGGARGNAHFLIGPASQLYSTPVSEAVEEIEDASLVEELQRRTRRLQTDVAEWPDMMEDADLGYGEDEY